MSQTGRVSIEFKQHRIKNSDNCGTITVTLIFVESILYQNLTNPRFGAIKIIKIFKKAPMVKKEIAIFCHDKS